MFPLARAQSPHFLWVAESPSTNAELRARHTVTPLPTGTVLATGHQPAGRGRLGRAWEFPAGSAIACSVLLPGTGLGELGIGWAPLLAGSALARAIRPELPTAETRVKWPNDVMVDGKKVSGILCELLSDGSVIVGAGVNFFMERAALPTDRATSLLVAGALEAPGVSLRVDEGPGQGLADRVLARFLAELTGFFSGDRPADELRATVVNDSWTLGSAVRVLLPGGGEERGRAVRLSPDGSLVVDRGDGSALLTVAAGDVEHLR